MERNTYKFKNKELLKTVFINHTLSRKLKNQTIKLYTNINKDDESFYYKQGEEEHIINLKVIEFYKEDYFLKSLKYPSIRWIYGKNNCRFNFDKETQSIEIYEIYGLLENNTITFKDTLIFKESFYNLDYLRLEDVIFIFKNYIKKDDTLKALEILYNKERDIIKNKEKVLKYYIFNTFSDTAGIYRSRHKDFHFKANQLFEIVSVKTALEIIDTMIKYDFNKEDLIQAYYFIYTYKNDLDYILNNNNLNIDDINTINNIIKAYYVGASITCNLDDENFKLSTIKIEAFKTLSKYTKSKHKKDINNAIKNNDIDIDKLCFYHTKAESFSEDFFNVKEPFIQGFDNLFEIIEFSAVNKEDIFINNNRNNPFNRKSCSISLKDLKKETEYEQQRLKGTFNSINLLNKDNVQGLISYDYLFAFNGVNVYFSDKEYLNILKDFNNGLFNKPEETITNKQLYYILSKLQKDISETYFEYFNNTKEYLEKTKTLDKIINLTKYIHRKQMITNRFEMINLINFINILIKNNFKQTDNSTFFEPDKKILNLLTDLITLYEYINKENTNRNITFYDLLNNFLFVNNNIVYTIEQTKENKIFKEYIPVKVLNVNPTLMFKSVTNLLSVIKLVNKNLMIQHNIYSDNPDILIDLSNSTIDTLYTDIKDWIDKTNKEALYISYGKVGL